MFSALLHLQRQSKPTKNMAHVTENVQSKFHIQSDRKLSKRHDPLRGEYKILS